MRSAAPTQLTWIRLRHVSTLPRKQTARMNSVQRAGPKPCKARTLPELREMAAKLAPDDAMDAAGGLATSATMAAAGAATASAAAASSVTVLGSSTLGSAAVALGLVSAPLWPAIAGAAAAGTVGYVLWKAVRKFQDGPRFAEHRVEALPAPAEVPRLPAP